MRYSGQALALASILLIGASGIGRAQWNGAGVSTGNGAVDFDTASNWSASTITGSFTSVNSAGAVVLTGDTNGSISITALNFNFPTAETLTLGTGLTTNDSINWSTTSGDLINISAANGTEVTLGSDLTLNLGTATAGRTLVDYTTSTATTTAVNATTAPVAIINSKITGTFSTSYSFNPSNYTQYGTTAGGSALKGEVNVVLTNNANSFSAAGGMGVGDALGFTSIANSGTASALGTTGSIALTNGGNLIYIGTGDQTSTNRAISLSASSGASGSAITNLSVSPSTLNVDFIGSTGGSGNLETQSFFTSGSNVIQISSAILDNNASNQSAMVAVAKTASTNISTVADYTGSSQSQTATSNGVLILGGSNLYSGGTSDSAGILLLTNTVGSATGTGAVVISGASTASAVLGGTGSASGLVTMNNNYSSIAPGTLSGIHNLTADVGTLTLNGGVTVNSASTLQLTLDLSGISGGASKLNLGSGALTLGTNNTINLTFNNLGAGTIAANTWYTVMTGSGSWASSATITDTTGLPAGFSGFSSLYSGGVTGGSLQIEFSAVPEPSTWALLGVGLALIGVVGIRRSASRPTSMPSPV